MSIITPVSKISPPQDIKSDLRPTALTSCLAKVLKGFTHRRLLKQVKCDIDPRQYAPKGHSTTSTDLFTPSNTRGSWHRKLLYSHIFCQLLKSVRYNRSQHYPSRTMFLKCRSDSVCLDKSPSPTEPKRCESVVPCLHGATPMVVSHRELNSELLCLL